MYQISMRRSLITFILPIRLLLLSQLCLSVSAQSAISTENELHCPKWTLPNDNGTNCKCGDSLNGVMQCDPVTLQTSIAICHCITFSVTYNRTVVGNCLFTCNFVTIPGHIYFETKDSCTPNVDVERTGQLCGECKKGFSPSVYSYNLACVQCVKDYKYNWLKYITVAFLPLTLFYFIVILFRINATSGSMNVYILVSQCVAAPVHLRMFSVHTSSSGNILFDLVVSSYSIWNLDFFRSVYRPFCLHPNVSTLQTFALEYTVAVYPLVLIILSYFFVKLHDHYSIVVRIWKPFYWCFAQIRREWNVHSSLIGAFATFILLSYVKIINVSFDLLTPVALYDIHGNRMPKLFLYYDGTYEFFGKHHLPYAFLALVMFLVFNIFPLLLLSLYPCKRFQRLLNYFNLSREPLRVFVETFNGCYKLEPFNCQYFAGFYLLIRIINLALIAMTTTPLYYPLTASMFSLAAFLVATIRPYKINALNILDTIFFGVLAMNAFAFPAWSYLSIVDPRHVQHSWCYALWFIQIFIPPLYGLCLATYNLVPRRVSIKLRDRFLKRLRKRNERELEDPIPYRLEHSDEYPPLLPK